MAAFDPNAAVGARVASPPGSPRSADWASTFRVAFCVGDDERCVRDGWSWLERHFLDPQDEVLLVRAWAPAELANGRLAMVAITVMALQEAITGVPLVKH